MFGYIKPHHPELRGRESAVYRSAYCALCHTLLKRYGFFAQFLVNYDFVLPALLFWRGKACTTKRRCVKHPFVKRLHLCENPSLDYAADALILLTGWKLRDTVQDSKFSLPALMLWRFFRSSFRKAAARLPREEVICFEKLSEIARLEREKDAQLLTASAFGELLACLSLFLGETDERAAAHSLFEHLGRWITLIDAVEDAPKDEKHNRYNAAIASGNPLEEIFVKMKDEQDAALKAFDLLPENDFTDITHNILHFGLLARGHEIYTKLSKG